MSNLLPVEEHSLNTPEVYHILINALAYVTEDSVHRIFDNADKLRLYKGSRNLVMLQNGSVYEFNEDGTKPVDNETVISADGRETGGQWWRLLTMTLDDLLADVDLTSPAYEILGPAVVVMGPDGKRIIRFATHEREGNYEAVAMGPEYAALLINKGIISGLSAEAIERLCAQLLACNFSGPGGNEPDPENNTISFPVGCIDLPDNEPPIMATAAEMRAWSGPLPLSFFMLDSHQFGQFVKDDLSTEADDNAMTIVAQGKRYSRVWDRAVLQARFFPGGLFNGNFTTLLNTNGTTKMLYGQPVTEGDEVPINLAIQYAKSRAESLGGAYRPIVGLPAGQLHTRATINGTLCNGLVIRGAGGRYINTTITGSTTTPAHDSIAEGAGVIFDFTNSSHAFLEDVTFGSDIGWGARASKVGALFALGQDPNTGQQQNGLNCGIKNCFISAENANMPTKNGGFGFIGVLNIKCEEFSVTNCSNKSNTPYIFSYNPDCIGTGKTFTAKSDLATIMPGIGSMGVINISGEQNSTYCVNAYNSAFYFNGVNSVRHFGYIGHAGLSAGTNEVAFKITASCTNIFLEGTCETFATLVEASGRVVELNTNFSMAWNKGTVIGSVYTPSLPTNIPVFNLTDIQGKSGKLGVTFNNPTDIGGRYLVYHAPVNGGNDPVYSETQLSSLEISCPEWNDYRVISPNLAKKCSNVFCNVQQPFFIEGGWVKMLFDFANPAGTISSLHPVTIARWNVVDRPIYGSFNAAAYIVKGTFVIYAGKPEAANTGARMFSFDGICSQNANGARGNPVLTVVPFANGCNNTDFINITGATMTMSFESDIATQYTFGRLNVTPIVTGSDTAAPVSVNCAVELFTRHNVNGVNLHL